MNTEKRSFSPDPENGQIRKIRFEFKVLFIPSSSGANAETSTTVQLFLPFSEHIGEKTIIKQFCLKMFVIFKIYQKH